MSNNNPIGVFDSGLGGLTVVKELMRLLPNEKIVYFGDTARVPYGTKSPASIIRFSIDNARRLLKHRVKMIVIACNSSSSYAVGALRKKFDVPIVGVIEPGAKKASAATRNRRIGVVATSATVNSGRYPKAVRRFLPSARVFSQACPLFVPLVEEGWLNRKATLDVARDYLSGLKRKKVDTLILGCTHYPLLKQTLQKTMGKNVFLVDSAKEVAKEVRKVLEASGTSRQAKARVKHKFIINDKPQAFERIAERFLGMDIQIKVDTDHV